MDKNSLLYLASQSQARHELLKQAAIPFIVIAIEVNEEDADVDGSVQEQVKKLAEYKHIGINVPALILAHEESKKPIFLLTADTLIGGMSDKQVYGKPRDRVHAREMIKSISGQEIIIATGMCLSVWQYHEEEEGWHCPFFESWVSQASAQFCVPDDEIEQYLDGCPMAMKGCGATVIDGIGIRYFNTMNGSYSGALGLDLFALREKLKKAGFSGF